MSTSRIRLHRHLPALALAALCAFPLVLPAAAVAAPVPAQTDPSADPPGRVGRVSDLQGSVWLYHPDNGDWVAAERNRPLTSGDRIATDAGARAELRIGSTTLRLDAGTELEVLRLDDDRISLQLHSGSAAVRVRSRETLAEFELLTGEGRFTVLRTGRYRFDRADEASHVTVYAGQALFEGQGSALHVEAGQRAEFWLDNANAAQYSIIEPARDAFASWNSERDRADDRSASQRYVSPEMTGVEDLDRYGRWEQNPDYGSVWVPTTVASGWAPYSTGRWAWVQPWGWTWVDDAPWGFAPFHYGRWVYAGNNWCWSPGTYVRRPVYAPALVAWIGGPRLSVGISLGGGPATPAVGWVPLAPREVYVPSYRVSPGYVRNVNITHVTNITNITTIVNNPQQAMAEQRDFTNRKFPHAVTVVPTSVLTTRQPVAAAAQRWRDAPGVRELNDAPNRPVAALAPQVAAPVAPARDPNAPRLEPTKPTPVARDGKPGWQRDARNDDNSRRSVVDLVPQQRRDAAPVVTPKPQAGPTPTPQQPQAQAPAPTRPGFNNRPESNRPENNRPESNRPERPASPPPAAVTAAPPQPAAPAAPAAPAVAPNLGRTPQEFLRPNPHPVPPPVAKPATPPAPAANPPAVQRPAFVPGQARREALPTPQPVRPTEAPAPKTQPQRQGERQASEQRGRGEREDKAAR